MLHLCLRAPKVILWRGKKPFVVKMMFVCRFVFARTNTMYIYTSRACKGCRYLNGKKSGRKLREESITKRPAGYNYTAHGFAPLSRHRPRLEFTIEYAYIIYHTYTIHIVITTNPTTAQHCLKYFSCYYTRVDIYVCDI